MGVLGHLQQLISFHTNHMSPSQPTLYRSTATIDLYEFPDGDRLATQMAAGRFLRVLDPEGARVCLLEDGYTAYLRPRDRGKLIPTAEHYQPVTLAASEVRARLPGAIAYALAAMGQPNTYLWGGTVPPNFDCSGLMQAAFASVGVWLPRDAYQQEAFATAIAIADLQAGDLIFFGTPAKATHVGLALGDGRYIHSSGRDQGRNGIGIDCLVGGDSISQGYAAQLRGAGRVDRSYIPPTD